MNGNLMPAKAKVEADGWVRCPSCGFKFKITDRQRWTGVRHRRCGTEINLENIADQIKPVWCLIGNVVRGVSPDGSGGGTKHFSAGTKLYCFPPQWGDGYRKILVLGRHRASSKLVEMVLDAGLIENWRVKLVYRPGVVDHLSGYWEGDEESRRCAEELCQRMRSRVS